MVVPVDGADEVEPAEDVWKMEGTRETVVVDAGAKAVVLALRGPAAVEAGAASESKKVFLVGLKTSPDLMETELAE